MVEPTCLENTPCHDDRIGNDENECLVRNTTELEMAELGFSAEKLKSLQQSKASSHSSVKFMCDSAMSCLTTECQLSKDLKRQNELEMWVQRTIKGSTSEFVFSGYRSTKSWWECTHSVFRVHNETVNIWTHLMGALVWILMMDATDAMLRYNRVDDVTKSVLKLCFLMCIAMPVFSTTYHTYKCVNEKLYRVLLSLDIVGIHLLMFARTMTEAYVVFYCDRSAWLNLVMISSLPAFALGVYGAWTRTQWPFIPAVLLAHIPVISFLLGSSEVNAPRIARYLTLSLSGSVTGIVAFVLFMYRIPECFYPGKFDIVGSSHQWWHVFTWIGPTLVLLGMLELTLYRNEVGCGLTV